MCGIAGKAIFNKSGEVRPKELHVMASSLNHRGPDDKGIFISKDRKVGLAHARLSIIDISQKGHQPMTFQNRYTITFNGEIYNFQKEREKLEKLGYTFTSNSDTEVVLALYSKYGKGFLKYLRGMFAMAIYDEVEKTIFLARDRMGVKPLKYVLNDQGIIFASELKAILTDSNVKSVVDPIAIQKYLLYGYVPSPLTGFAGINKLEPGTYMFINLRRKTVEKKKYWEPKFDEKLDLSERQWCQRILSTLEESTRLRMISDVPIGAFLSGGVDSSGVVATMAGLSSKPVKTFSVVFDDPKYSEKKYADNIVKRYKTDHQEILAKPSSISTLPEIAHQYEEPFSDNSSLVSFMISKETSKHVKVVLNGDGADESFAGYPNRYLRLRRDVDYAKWIEFARPAAALGIGKINKFLDKSKLPLYERFNTYNQVFSLEDIYSISKEPITETMTTTSMYKGVRKCFRSFKGHDIKDAGLKFDLLYFLPDQLLAKMDIATMRYSLEARSPFLDHNMVELAGKIPFRLKVKNGETKYILKKALEELVPKENLYRPKVGFTVPLDKWFKGDLNQYAEKVLLSKNSMIKEYIDIEKIRPMILSKNCQQDFGQKIWTLMMMELWLKDYFN